jgi:hypothetical protein
MIALKLITTPRQRYELAMAACRDVADRAMRAGGRTAWSDEDYAAGIEVFNRICPPPEGVE